MDCGERHRATVSRSAGPAFLIMTRFVLILQLLPLTSYSYTMREPVFPIPVDNSMETLPEASSLRQIYPEDMFPNGSYAQLPHGRVRYWLLGPEDGTRVVLIHGISTPSIVWKAIAPYLAAHGLRVLVYDLYGKGYSQAPKVKYDATLFITQLALLLQYIGWDNAHIVGFSMGGAIAAGFAAMLPQLVAGKIVFMSSAGLMERVVPKSATRSLIPQYQEIRELQEQWLTGYRTSLQSCFEDGPVRGMSYAFNKLAGLHVGPEKKPLQALVIHGTADATVPYSEGLKISEKIPGAQLITIEGGEHNINMKDGDWQKVSETIVKFIH
ncbi:Dihydrolipoyllysine-residue acetyltransferase component of acetoin cleaving system [Grifola frondosa]|uniref:Dihydrolipoyllysine-residue acetyltransferase component of acetoin cleaving system n=1 Tax=Grifola frondosa TaxID=5627 RepID=A0A1C7MWA4_GRIFR|nr:Dihydrolipoyllysine-residue acetyltransferase component of acetoin cleaving system [Grifola frondosa]